MQIKIENFEGPFEILIKMIEDEEMDITQVALAEVADQYIGYLSGVEERRPELLADFLVVASKLLYIKSRALLPELIQTGEEDDGLTLERQLLMYKRYYEASKVIDKLFSQKQFAFSRQLALSVKTRFVPAKSLNGAKLLVVFEEITQSIAAVKKIARRSMTRVLSIKHKIEKIRQMLQKFKRVRFDDILDKREKEEMIVSFLGMLEMAKQRQVVIVQEDIFGEIYIDKI